MTIYGVSGCCGPRSHFQHVGGELVEELRELPAERDRALARVDNAHVLLRQSFQTLTSEVLAPG